MARTFVESLGIFAAWIIVLTVIYAIPLVNTARRIVSAGLTKKDSF